MMTRVDDLVEIETSLSNAWPLIAWTKAWKGYLFSIHLTQFPSIFFGRKVPLLDTWVLQINISVCWESIIILQSIVDDSYLLLSWHEEHRMGLFRHYTSIHWELSELINHSLLSYVWCHNYKHGGSGTISAEYLRILARNDAIFAISGHFDL